MAQVNKKCYEKDVPHKDDYSKSYYLLECGRGVTGEDVAVVLNLEAEP